MMIEKTYLHEYNDGAGKYAPRVDIYTVREDGCKDHWMGALIKGDNEFIKVGIVPSEVIRNFELMLGE